MKVIVILGDERFNLSDVGSVADVLTLLDLSSESYLVLLDGRIVVPEEILKQDVTLQLIPTIAGG